MIRVLIAASSPLARAGLEAMLSTSPDVEVTGGAAEWRELGGPDPDVVIADADRDLLDLVPGAAVILIAAEPHHAWTAEALRSGVRAVISPEMSPNQIIAAVEAAAAGLAVFDPEELEPLLAARRPPRTLEPLSARETEVLRMMAEGFSNKEIAFRLGISGHTVKFHATSIMGKLNAGSRTEAVTLGIRQGLIPI